MVFFFTGPYAAFARNILELVREVISFPPRLTLLDNSAGKWAKNFVTNSGPKILEFFLANLFFWFKNLSVSVLSSPNATLHTAARFESVEEFRLVLILARDMAECMAVCYSYLCICLVLTISIWRLWKRS